MEIACNELWPGSPINSTVFAFVIIFVNDMGKCLHSTLALREEHG